VEPKAIDVPEMLAIGPTKSNSLAPFEPCAEAEAELACELLALDEAEALDDELVVDDELVEAEAWLPGLTSTVTVPFLPEMPVSRPPSQVIFTRLPTA
jgi:hypothetical protein